MQKALKIKRIIVLINVLILLAIQASFASNRPQVKIELSGLKGELLKNVDTKLKLKAGTLEKVNLENIQNFYRESLEDIPKTLKFYGYFHAQTTPQTIKTLKNNRGYELSFMVNLGPPLKIAKIDLQISGSGAQELKNSSRLKKFPLKTGEIFTIDNYNHAKGFLLDTADRYGYPRALLNKKEVQISLKNNTATIILHLDTKERSYFGKIIFTTNFFSKKFLARFLPFQSGEYYSNKKLHKLQKALSNSSFFQKIEINSDAINNQLDKIPVEIIVTPKKSKQYALGAGYGTDTGVRGSAELNLRYLTNTAHSFSSSIQASEIQKNLELNYLIPGNYPPTDSYKFSVAGEKLDLDKGKSLAVQLGATYTTSIKSWQQIIKLNLQHEHYQLTGQPYETSNLLLSTISWSYNQKDDLIRPNKGYAINLKLIGATKYLFSTSNFIQAQLKAKSIYPLSSKTQVILNSILGYTAICDVNKLPLSLQLYTGGTQSIRGFGYNTIGPGTNLIVGSATLRQKIYGDWYIEGFFDAGNVGNDILDKPAHSVGIGIVWRTPIGALELTYAKAISKPGSPGMIQFNMGPEL